MSLSKAERLERVNYLTELQEMENERLLDEVMSHAINYGYGGENEICYDPWKHGQSERILKIRLIKCGFLLDRDNL